MNENEKEARVKVGRLVKETIAINNRDYCKKDASYAKVTWTRVVAVELLVLHLLRK